MLELRKPFVVDAVERVPATAPMTRVRLLRVPRATPGLVQTPAGGPLPGHRLSSPVAGSATGRRHRLTVRARTTGRRWSRTAVRVVDLG